MFGPAPKFNTSAWHRYIRKINAYFYGDHYHPRRVKRCENAMRNRVEDAYERGAYDRLAGVPANNLYRPGKRHDAYNLAYANTKH
jgi:hypothetical protein